ncbi:PREDICTED: uncharacterized protein LOC105367667 [Ceratosolen solmsi marchali]|uniref:Uncharacterized protein LOC105367667 n=1 Tax=Ceratosolen solmsi marchali TaxID=326594 RepID=A0AAJ6YUL5_9HYME|nr:PREDICTED: uncharacterized protein LOC105367667 [Ceratosolen solmsi marchali]
MVRLECCLLLLLLVLGLAQCGRSEDRLAEAERLRNIPPELSVVDRTAPGLDSKAQARFLPFSASFSLSAGGNNAHTFSVAGSPEGVGLSQSSSHGSASNGGIPGSFSASQSSSIAAGLGGLSASNSNSFASNDPLFGPQSQAHGNAFTVGQGSASANAHGVNGQASSGAQSAIDGIESEASSNAQNLIHLGSSRPGWSNRRPGYASDYDDDYYYYNSRRMPTLTISVNDRPGNGWYNSRDQYDSWRQPDYCNYYGGWYRDPRCRSPRVKISRPVYRPVYDHGPYYDRLRDPRQEASNVHYSTATATATSSAQSGSGGFAHGQSASQAHQSQGGPSSSTSNEVQSSGNAAAHAQGASSSVQQLENGLQASLNSASIAANSRPGGSSSGSASAGSSGSRVTGSTINGASVNGAATSGGLVVFPGPSSHQQIIPQEFIRSARPKAKTKAKTKANPVEEFVDELADAVYDAFDD